VIISWFQQWVTTTTIIKLRQVIEFMFGFWKSLFFPFFLWFRKLINWWLTKLMIFRSISTKAGGVVSLRRRTMLCFTSTNARVLWSRSLWRRIRICFTTSNARVYYEAGPYVAPPSVSDPMKFGPQHLQQPPHFSGVNPPPPTSCPPKQKKKKQNKKWAFFSLFI